MGCGGRSWEQKSIKKWRQQGKGSEHRFLIDFLLVLEVKLGGKMEAKWSQKGVENYPLSKASKMQPKGWPGRAGTIERGRFWGGPLRYLIPRNPD